MGPRVALVPTGRIRLRKVVHFYGLYSTMKVEREFEQQEGQTLVPSGKKIKCYPSISGNHFVLPI